MNVVIADDHALLRESIADALSARGISVVGRAGDSDELLRIVGSTQPDVVMVDIRMPPTYTNEGLQAAAAIRALDPRPGVLVLSQHVETSIAVDLLRADPRGMGYLLKDRVTRIDTLVEALERVHAGGSVVDPDVVARLLGRPRAHGPLDELTPRELAVLGAMAEGRSNRGIGDLLDIEPKTVEFHITQILGKLAIDVDDRDHRRVLAVLVWLRERTT